MWFGQIERSFLEDDLWALYSDLPIFQSRFVRGGASHKRFSRAINTPYFQKFECEPHYPLIQRRFNAIASHFPQDSSIHL